MPSVIRCWTVGFSQQRFQDIIISMFKELKGKKIKNQNMQMKNTTENLSKE